MEILEVNKETCNSCGICVAICPNGIIDFSDQTYPRGTALTEKFCSTCGHCVAACPTGSLSHRGMSVSECPPIQRALKISAAQMDHLIKSRRSIRAYHDKPVPRDTLTHLIEVARYAPTGHNTQTVQWMVIDNKEVLQHFTEIGNDWMRWRIKSKSGPFRFPNELEWFEVMLKRYEKGENEFLRDPPALIVTHSQKDDHAATASCTIALAYLDLAANSSGLGCCWLGLFNMVASTYPPMIKALGLPEGHKPFGSITVGYPKYKYQRIPTRKAPPIIWHP